jgi:hypothetical protein
VAEAVGDTMPTTTIDVKFDHQWCIDLFRDTMQGWRERLRLFDKVYLRQDLSKSDSFKFDSDSFKFDRFVLSKAGIPVASFIKVGDDCYILTRLYRANINFQFTDGYRKPLPNVISHVTRSEVLHFYWRDVNVLLGVCSATWEEWLRLRQRLTTSIAKFHRIVDVSLLACQFDHSKMNPIDWHWMKQALFTPKFAMTRFRMVRMHRLTIPELKVIDVH